MRYLILVAQADVGSTTAEPSAFSAYVAAHGAELSMAAWADADEATTLQRTGQEVEIVDGPFAETMGAYYDVELPDLDHAIAAARLLPGTCSLEIRPTVKIG